MTGNIFFGLAEYEDMIFALHLLRSDDVFIDIGANAGSYTVLAAGAVGSKVEAVEPIQETADRLLANLVLNGIEDKVRLHRVGLGSRRGVLQFTATADTTNRVATQGEPGVMVRVERLDDLLPDCSPTLIKVDVEGFEAEVLAGAKNMLKRPTLLGLIIEINESFRHFGGTEDEVIESLASAGFRPFRYFPETRSLQKLPGRNPVTGNTIFLRDVSAVEQRLQSATAYSLRSMTVTS